MFVSSSQKFALMRGLCLSVNLGQRIPGSAGDLQGIEEDDVLLEVGNEELKPLDDLPGETFKSILKARPLKMLFESNRDVFNVLADSSITKLGVTFTGVPPEQIRVKKVTSGEFGSLLGVHEGYILLRLGKTDLNSLEQMSADDFKGYLKDRPVRMEFKVSTASPASSQVTTPRGKEAEPQSPVATEKDRKPEGTPYEVLADDTVGKLGISFHGMPPGQIRVKGVTSGEFGSQHGVHEGDILLQVGKTDLVSLEQMSADDFKGYLKGRPLRMEFKVSTASPASSQVTTPRGKEEEAQSPVATEKDRKPEGTPYEVLADDTVGKLGISFHGMPPGQIRVKGVTSGEFGSQHGVHEGDILLQVGKTDLVSLEQMSADDFKGYLKGRPLRMEFKVSTASPASSQVTTPRGKEEEAQSPVATEKDRKPEGTPYEVLADDTVGKVGISFHGMPPGQIRVKGVTSGEFGSQHGVHEGDILLQVGKTDLVSLEQMSADDFKGYLKGRPLRMEFKVSTASPASSQVTTPRGKEEEAQSPVATEKDRKPEGTPYEVLADDTVGKLGMSFHGMPPGQIRVKGLTSGEFGSQHGVHEGDILLQVGKTDLVSLEQMSADDFKGYLKGRPLRMEFKVSTASPASSQVTTPRGKEAEPQSPVATEKDRKPEGTPYEVLADDTVGKLGISFHGMPPGQIRVKGLTSGEFGSQHGVHEGDILLQVGKTDLVSLEQMSADDFKGYLKGRPLRMEFKVSTASPASSQVTTPRGKEEEPQSPVAEQIEVKPPEVAERKDEAAVAEAGCDEERRVSFFKR